VYIEDDDAEMPRSPKHILPGRELLATT